MRAVLLVVAMIACSGGSSSTIKPGAGSAGGSAVGSANNVVRDQVLAVTPHVLLMKSQATFAEYRDIMKQALALDRAVKIAAPFIALDGFVTSKTAKDVQVVIKGDDEKQIGKLLGLGKLVFAGSFADLERGGDPPPVVIGERLAKALGVGVGDTVTLSVPVLPNFDDWSSKPERGAERVHRVVALFRLPLGEYDLRAVYTTFAAAQTLAERGDTATGIALGLGHPDDADEIAPLLEQAVGGPPYQTMTWRELNRDLLPP